MMFSFLKRKDKSFFRHAEDRACDWLKKRRFKIIKRNFKSYCGEIDIIAEKNNIIYFIEVKARRNFNFGAPYEAVNSKKLKKISKTSCVFLKIFPEYKDYDLKFYVLSISYYGDKNEVELIEVIEI